MTKFEYTIKDMLGIHARPAGMLVKEASRFSSSIIIAKNGNNADAKRLFKLMGLGVKQGDKISVVVAGEDENEAAATLEDFFKTNL